MVSSQGLTVLLVLVGCTLQSDITKLLETEEESYQDVLLSVTEGVVPDWLRGSLVRVGPGKFEHGHRRVTNILDGLAKVHSWTFTEKGVLYDGEMLKSGLYNKTMTDGVYAAFPVMGPPLPDFSIREELKIMTAGITYMDNANIAVWDLDGKRVSMSSETPMMHQVDKDTLHYNQPLLSPAAAKDSFSFGEKPLFSASHFSRHPSDGSSFNYVAVMSFLPWNSGCEYRFQRYTHDKQGNVHVKQVAVVKASMTDIRLVHAFGVTENFILVPRFNFEFKFDMTKMLRMMSHTGESIFFNYDKPFLVDIIDINTGDVYHYELPASKGIHPMNTAERLNERGELEVIFDAPVFTDPSSQDMNKAGLFDIFTKDWLLNPEELYKRYPQDTTLRRHVFNINTGKWAIEDFPQSWAPVDSLVEFPFINPLRAGNASYCHAYFQQWYLKTNAMDLLKIDLCDGGRASTWRATGMHVHEPVFVPRPGSEREEDGVVVAPIFNSEEGRTYLGVWDPKDMALLAKLDGRVDVPFTIHGGWFD